MKKKSVIENVLDTITVLTIIATTLFAIVGICFNIVYITTSVRGFSMYPTLNSNVTDANADGDVVFINRFADFGNNDIVVANVSWWNKGPIIKRVIAGPGDVVQIKEESESYGLYVNGKLLYSKEKTTVSPHGEEGGTAAYYEKYLNFLINPNFEKNVVKINDEKYIVMQKDEYFLLGDNWAESTDCMQYGPVKAEKIVGRVDIVVDAGDSQIWAMIKEIVKITFVPNWV